MHWQLQIFQAFCKKWKRTGDFDTNKPVYRNGIWQCAILIMKSGKRGTMEGKELPNQERIGKLVEKENYKYLGIYTPLNKKRWKKK